MDNNQALYKEAAKKIKEARAILITAGAGIGVDSGLPDFRGNKGFWRAYPPYAKLNLGFTDMANPHWFKRDPKMAWGFYGHRLNLYRSTKPHKGFTIIFNWALLKKEFFVFTSNVDGQFEKAGFPDSNVVECHGSIHHYQCSIPCDNQIFPLKDLNITINQTTMKATSPLPYCQSCGALVRPNILMFGDWNFNFTRTQEQEDRYREWLSQNIQNPIVIIEIGAGTSVPTVRMQSENVAKIAQNTLIRINLREPNCYLRNSIQISNSGLNALEGINHYIK